MSSSRLSRLSWVSTPRSCASVKSADTQCSARWSLHEQVFSSGFTNIAFNKVGRGRRVWNIKNEGVVKGSEGMAGSMTNQILHRQQNKDFENNQKLNFITGFPTYPWASALARARPDILVVLQSVLLLSGGLGQSRVHAFVLFLF